MYRATPKELRTIVAYAVDDDHAKRYERNNAEEEDVHNSTNDIDSIWKKGI